jgi:hypothetical protein
MGNSFQGINPTEAHFQVLAVASHVHGAKLFHSARQTLAEACLTFYRLVILADFEQAARFLQGTPDEIESSEP